MSFIRWTGTQVYLCPSLLQIVTFSTSWYSMQKRRSLTLKTEAPVRKINAPQAAEKHTVYFKCWFISVSISIVVCHMFSYVLKHACQCRYILCSFPINITWVFNTDTNPRGKLLFV